jgi:hypothetical protein
MIIDEFLGLPSTVTYEDVIFQLSFVNDDGEGKLAYDLMYALDASPHAKDVNGFGCWYNPWQEGNTGFLWYQGDIGDDASFHEALVKLKVFLIENKLMSI